MPWGELLNLLGDIDTAEWYYLRAIAIRERELGLYDDSTELVRRRLEGLLEKKGLWQPIQRAQHNHSTLPGVC